MICDSDDETTESLIKTTSNDNVEIRNEPTSHFEEINQREKISTARPQMSQSAITTNDKNLKPTNKKNIFISKFSIQLAVTKQLTN